MPAHDPYDYLDKMDDLEAAPKFSVGQRVRLTEDYAGLAPVREGDEGVVTLADPNYYTVRMDVVRGGYRNATWSFHDAHLEAVEEPFCAGASEENHLASILEDRGSRYGSFEDNSQISQELKEGIRSGFAWDNMNADQREALDMIAAKISRIVTGDPDYVDNWDDIAGYATLVSDRLRRDQGDGGIPEGAR